MNAHCHLSRITPYFPYPKKGDVIKYTYENKGKIYPYASERAMSRKIRFEKRK